MCPRVLRVIATMQSAALMLTAQGHQRCHIILPIAHIVKVLCELSQIGTLLLILFLGPKQHLRNLEGEQKSEEQLSAIVW